MRFFFFIVLFIYTQFLHAQSYIEEIEKLNDKIQQIRDEVSIETIELYSNTMLEMSEKENYEKGIIDATLHLAWCKWNQNKLAEGVMICKDLSVKYSNMSINQYLNLYTTLGEVYSKLENNPESLRFFLRAIRINQDTLQFSYHYTWLRIGNLYLDENLNDKAISIYHQLYNNVNQLNVFDKEFLIKQSLNGLGLAFRQKQHYDSANYYFLKGLEYARTHYNKGELKPSRNDSIMISVIKGNIGEIFLKKGNVKESISYILEDYELCFRYEEYLNTIISLNYLGEAFKLLKNYEESEKVYWQAIHIGESKGFYFPLAKTYQGLSELYLLKENPQKGMEFLNKAMQIKDSLIQLNRISSSHQMHIIYDIEEKESQNHSLIQQNQLQKAEIEYKSLLFFISTLLGFILMITSIFVYRTSINRKRQNLLLSEQNKEIENQKVEIEAQRDLLGDTNLKLKQLNDTKNHLFSIIAHDLRSPIISFQGLGKLIRNYLQQEKFDKILNLSDKLDQSSQGLSNLLDNLLTWASGQRGLLPYEPQSLNASEIVKECLALFQDMATSKEIELCNQVPENLWTYADKNGFRVIIRNLIGNALKFTYAGGNISVHAKIQEKEIIFSVADTGIGMDVEILQRLFEQKTVNHNITSSFGNGAGLGLMLCKDFIKLHGGKIWVESILGKGTTFYFTLPFTESMLNNNIIMNGSFKKSNIFSKI